VSNGKKSAPVARPVAENDDAIDGKNILLAMSWYYPEMHRGVARFARDHNWHITADLDEVVPKHWQGDGILTHLGARPGIWRALRPFHEPMVDLTESRPNIQLPRVTMDNAAIGKLAARHFLDRGFRNFAFVQRWNSGVARRRRAAFTRELESAGRTCQVLCWQTAQQNANDTRQQRHRWLRHCLARLPKPVAVFANRDAEAVEVIEACLAGSICIPDQVGVLGVDNTVAICDCLRVPLSSIDSNLEEVGYQGAALLHRLMRGEPPPPSPIYISPLGVAQRRSTDSIAVDHPGVAAALRFIHDHAAQPISAKDVFRHVAMSRSGLEKAFRDHFVRPPMEELRRVRLERAKKMLSNTDERIISIAARTGFQTSHNLCRVFKQQVGATPRQYRLDNRPKGGS